MVKLPIAESFLMREEHGTKTKSMFVYHGIGRINISLENIFGDFECAKLVATDGFDGKFSRKCGAFFDDF